MQDGYRRRSLATLLAALFGLSAPLTMALADSVPESIRIQQKAEKAYFAAPVVPIGRQNAHHREPSKDAPAASDERGSSAAPSAQHYSSDH